MAERPTLELVRQCRSLTVQSRPQYVQDAQHPPNLRQRKVSRTHREYLKPSRTAPRSSSQYLGRPPLFQEAAYLVPWRTPVPKQQAHLHWHLTMTSLLRLLVMARQAWVQNVRGLISQHLISSLLLTQLWFLLLVPRNMAARAHHQLETVRFKRTVLPALG